MKNPILCISNDNETYWCLDYRRLSELARLPLEKMPEFVEEQGVPTTVHSSAEADFELGPVDLYDADDEAELREELRTFG